MLFGETHSFPERGSPTRLRVGTTKLRKVIVHYVTSCIVQMGHSNMQQSSSGYTECRGTSSIDHLLHRATIALIHTYVLIRGSLRWHARVRR